MQLVTLTSDFGHSDPYIGFMKGSLLAVNPSLQIIDLSHQVVKHNIVHASMIMKGACKNFPKGTIHLVSVNVFYNPKPRFLLIKYNQQYFVGPDNGIFSLVFKKKPHEIYELYGGISGNITSARDVFCHVIEHLGNDVPPEQIGELTHNIQQRVTLQPITSTDFIRGAIIHIDEFGNAILNIDKNIFDRIRQNRPFEIYYKRFDPIRIISKNYGEVDVGDVVCLFNAMGLMEIAVNAGKFSELYHLQVDDSIQIDFLDNS